MGSLVYSDNRLHDTAEKNWDADIVVAVLVDTFKNTVRDEYSLLPTEYALKVIGLHNKLTRLTGNYSGIPDTFEAVSLISPTLVRDAIDSFDSFEWKESFFSICSNFDLNPDRFSTMLLRLLNDLDSFGSILLYATEIGLITDADELWGVLSECQHFLYYDQSDDSEWAEKLRGIYRYISRQIQSISGVIDGDKADGRVAGFWAKLIEILVAEQNFHDDYDETAARDRLFDVFDKYFSGKHYEVSDGVLFPGISSALKQIAEFGGDEDEFLRWIDRLNLKYVLALSATDLVVDKSEGIKKNAVVCLNPSRNGLSIISDRAYKTAKKSYKHKLTKLTTIPTLTRSAINLDEVVTREIYDWVHKIADSLVKPYLKGRLN